MQQPLFSVLMANFNNGKYIKSALQSVCNQTYQNLELIVVDDGSKDDSIEQLQHFSLEYPHIRIFQNPDNKGCGFTKNRAAALGKGEIMGFLDPDDMLLPSAVQTMVQSHLSHPNVSLINSSHYVCNENLDILREAYGACAIPSSQNYLTHGRGITAFASFKSSFYKLTSGVDPNFKRAVDQDIYYKLEEVGDTLFIPQILYKYRVHQNGISSFDNVSKARYWLVLAKEAAYNRRLNQAGIKNITPSELRSWWSILYATKSGVAIGRGKICPAMYWLMRSFLKSPIDRFFLFKLKSFLNHLKLKWGHNLMR